EAPLPFGMARRGEHAAVEFLRARLDAGENEFLGRPAERPYVAVFVDDGLADEGDAQLVRGVESRSNPIQKTARASAVQIVQYGKRNAFGIEKPRRRPFFRLRHMQPATVELDRRDLAIERRMRRPIGVVSALYIDRRADALDHVDRVRRFGDDHLV